MKYTIEIVSEARRVMDRLDGAIYRRVVARIRQLADEPRPSGGVKLTGPDDLWRVRVNDWRIIYSIQDRELIVCIVKVGHRREIYR